MAPASTGRFMLLKMVPKRRICYGRTESITVVFVLERRGTMGNGKPGFDKTKVKNEPINNCTYTLCSLTLSKTRCQKKKRIICYSA